MDSQLLSSNLIPYAVGGIVVYVTSGWIYNLFFHPLRHIPGPWTAAMTDLWMTSQDAKFRLAYAVEEAFQKYGPVVRIAPNKVAFLDAPSTRTVYSASTRFTKSVFYKALLTGENDHAMTTLEPAPHMLRKRAYAPHYTPINLARYQPEMQQYINVLLNKLNECKGTRAVECLVMFRRLMADVTFVSTYGQRLESLESWDSVNQTVDAASEMIASIELFPIRGVMRASIPKLLWHVLAKIPVASWKMVVDSDAKIARYVRRARDVIVDKDARLKAGNFDGMDEEDERVPMLQRLMRYAAKSRPEERMTDKDIISEGMGHTIAGVDTTSNVLTYALYTIGNRPDILNNLRAELDPIMPKDEDGMRRVIPDINVLYKLPYLNAFVKEVLRVYGAGPSLLERVVTDTLVGDFVIKGYKIPPGSIVATQSWSVHRVASVFPKPYEFIPERWFDETEEMRASLIPFGTGGRICGGMNVAHFMVRMTLSGVISNYNVVIPPQTTPDSMEPRFAFVILPKAQKAELVFARRSD